MIVSTTKTMQICRSAVIDECKSLLKEAAEQSLDKLINIDKKKEYGNMKFFLRRKCQFLWTPFF